MTKSVNARRLPGRWATRLLPALVCGVAASSTTAATFTVTTADDSGAGSLRAAIESANALPGADVVQFSIGSGLQVIRPVSALPVVTEEVLLDGTTQPGYSGTPLIEVRGSLAGTASGIQIQADNCHVKGLLVAEFEESGIHIQGSSNTISRCFIGADDAGTSWSPNYYGIRLTSGSNNVIGEIGGGNVISGNAFTNLRLEGVSSTLIVANRIGTNPSATAAVAYQGGFLGLDYARGIDMSQSTGTVVGGAAAGAGNVISGNLQDGLYAMECPDLVLKGNRIGSDSTGTTAIPNLNVGAWIRKSANVVIGGTTAAERNLLSGNKNQVQLRLDQSSGIIQGNYVGPDITGNATLGNEIAGGIILEACSGVQLGGTAAGAGNLISGNQKFGVACRLNCTSITIQGNLIGVNAAGNAALPNKEINLGLSGGGASCLIGGTAPGARNVISASFGGDGINLGGTNGVVIQGNLVGTDITGTVAMPNFNSGIAISGLSTTGNTIGGNTAAARNIISGNGLPGIWIRNSARNQLIQGNYIGTDISGTVAMPNGTRTPSDGIYAGIMVDTGSSALIGGTGAGEPNLISGNKSHGIMVNGSARATTIVGNLIGLDVTGAAHLPNGGDGVVFDGATPSVAGTNHMLGGTTPAHRNIIAFNTGAGVGLDDSTSVTVVGNRIGMLADGTTLAGNGGAGVRAQGGSKCTVGGISAGTENLISANGGDGLSLAGCSNFSVLGNKIGTKIDGLTPAGNGGAGVSIGAGTSANIIGGTTAAARNLIAANGGSGVLVTGGTGNQIQGNYIGTDITGAAALANNGDGVVLGGTNNVLGGPAAARNIICAHPGDGVEINGGTGCAVSSNWISVDVNGNALPNGGDGIKVVGGTGNVIGSQGGNVVSRNPGYGISLRNTTSNTVLNNLVGTDTTGNSAFYNDLDPIYVTGGSQNHIGAGNILAASNAVGNVRDCIVLENTADNVVQGVKFNYNASGALAFQGRHAVRLNGSTGNTIGGMSAAMRNIIGGLSGAGVLVENSSSGNQVAGNYIGTDDTGTSAVPNPIGVVIKGGSSGNVIGGNTGSRRNIIAGNGGGDTSTGFGVHIQSDASANTVQGNWIGLDSAGNAMPNFRSGVLVQSNSNSIAGNITSGNLDYGILIPTGSANTVTGNWVGLNSTGTSAVPNGKAGMLLTSSGNTVGGTAAGAGNVFSGNTLEGLHVFQCQDSVIQGNRFGTNAPGTAAVPNGTDSLRLERAPQTLVGGTTTGAGNQISGSLQRGIVVKASPSTQIAGNLIGTTSDGLAALSNTGAGLLRDDPVLDPSYAGGLRIGPGNTVSGNTGPGILISGEWSLETVIDENRVGTDITGNAALPNGTAGIQITSATATLIGGLTGGSANMVAGNPVGVLVTGTTSTQILADSFTSNTVAAIDLEGDGPTPNDFPDADNLQNFPSLTNVVRADGFTTITATVTSLPSTSLRLDFYHSTVAHPSGYGEGANWIGSATVTTDGAGNGSASATFSASIPSQSYITATATRLDEGGNGSTSEFSPPFFFVPVALSGFGVE